MKLRNLLIIFGVATVAALIAFFCLLVDTVHAVYALWRW